MTTSSCLGSPTVPVCQYTIWSSWSSCTRSCGSGSQQRTRSLHPTPCDSSSFQQPSLSQSRVCNTDPCPGSPELPVHCSITIAIDFVLYLVNCQTTAWGDWSGCSSTCGSPGRQTRDRQISVHPVGTGQPCGNLTQTKSCSPPPCTTGKLFCR